MTVRVAAALAAVLFAWPSLSLAQSRSSAARERSADLLRQRAAGARAAAAGGAGALAGTGDADSFGRNLTYLGVAQTLSVVLTPDCTGSSPDLERCIPLAPSPETTSFDEADLARIELPAKATHSLVCFALTPFVTFDFFNDTGVPQPAASFNASATITIESTVLDDPALVDPQTGQPFGGRLTLALGTYGEFRSLGAGEQAFKRLTMSRACIGGLLSRVALTEGFGLTDAQATEFFKRPITFRFGSRGSAALVDFADYFYGIRLYGD